MIKRIDRRIVLAVGAASILSSCSRPCYCAPVTVQPRAVNAVQEFVRAFAAQHDYQPEDVVSRGPNDQYYIGRWSTFWFYAQSQIPAESYIVEFRHRDEILFPRDNLETRLQDFFAAITQIDGVFAP
jgi:hypothetical protein